MADRASVTWGRISSGRPTYPWYSPVCGVSQHRETYLPLIQFRLRGESAPGDLLTPDTVPSAGWVSNGRPTYSWYSPISGVSQHRETYLPLIQSLLRGESAPGDLFTPDTVPSPVWVSTGRPIYPWYSSVCGVSQHRETYLPLIQSRFRGESAPGDLFTPDTVPSPGWVSTGRPIYPSYSPVSGVSQHRETYLPLIVPFPGWVSTGRPTYPWYSPVSGVSQHRETYLPPIVPFPGWVSTGRPTYPWYSPVSADFWKMFAKRRQLAKWAWNLWSCRSAGVVGKTNSDFNCWSKSMSETRRTLHSNWSPPGHWRRTRIVTSTVVRTTNVLVWQLCLRNWWSQWLSYLVGGECKVVWN